MAQKTYSINLQKVIIMKTIKKAIAHFKKLLECEQFVITGSVAFKLLGLTNICPSDLDVVLVTPTKETIDILKRLQIDDKPNPNYPDSDNQFRVKYDDLNVDFFIQHIEEPVIIVADDGALFSVSKPMKIIRAKKKYKSNLKQLLQRKSIAELFFQPHELQDFITFEQKLLEVAADDGDIFEDITEEDKDKKPAPKVKKK